MGLCSLALFLPSRFPTFPQTSLSLAPNRRHSFHFLRRVCPTPAFPTISLSLFFLHTPPIHPSPPASMPGCSVFLPRPSGSIKTTKCCLSIRWYAHSWSTTLLRHSPGGTGLPTLSRLPLSVPPLAPVFRFSPFSRAAVASFFVLLSEDLRIHGRSLRFLIIPA